MEKVLGRWGHNRTLLVALLATALVGWLVSRHVLAIDRCVPLVIIWGLAMNSQEIIDHRLQVLALAKLGVKAAIEGRAGQEGACLDDAATVGKGVLELTRQVRAEREATVAETHG